LKEWPLEAEREFWRDACAPGTSPDSLWWFVRIAWGAEWYFRKTGKARWLTSRVHKPFLRWLSKHIMEWREWVRTGKQQRKILLVLLPRDVGKTVLGTKCAMLWMHLFDPNMTTYIGSETHDKAKSFLGATKGVITGEDDDYAWFPWLYGNWRSTLRTWSDKEIRHAYRRAMSIGEPSIGTFGLDMGITGMHPMAVGFDDPNSAETLTEKTLHDAREAYDSVMYALNKGGFFLGSMTRYANNDCPGHIMRNGGIASWEGIPNPDKHELAVSPDGLVHVYFLQGRDTSNKTDEHPKGVPVFPEVYSREDMDRRELADPVNFASQIQNTPSLGEHMPLEYAQLERLTISRDDLPAIDFATVHLDTAFKDEERMLKGDWNVILGALHSLADDGKVFIDRIIRKVLARPEQYISLLCGYLMSLRSRGYRIKAITDEMEAGGKQGTFKQLLQVSLAMAGFRIGPDSIILFNRRTAKAVRLRKAAAYWVEGYARIIKGIEHEDRLKFELVNLEKGDHDDIVDAAADIWQPEIWKKPQRSSPETSGEMLIQPGDEVLRPGVMQELRLYGSALEERISQYSRRTDFQADDPV
jgi:hypothetical protein